MYSFGTAVGILFCSIPNGRVCTASSGPATGDSCPSIAAWVRVPYPSNKLPVVGIHVRVSLCIPRASAYLPQIYIFILQGEIGNISHETYKIYNKLQQFLHVRACLAFLNSICYWYLQIHPFTKKKFVAEYKTFGIWRPVANTDLTVLYDAHKHTRAVWRKYLTWNYHWTDRFVRRTVHASKLGLQHIFMDLKWE